MSTDGQSTERVSTQRLHLVVGGELSDVGEMNFRDPAKLDVVGIFPSYAKAYDAWKAKAQATVDNAEMRYFIVHIHRLFDPQTASVPDRP